MTIFQVFLSEFLCFCALFVAKPPKIFASPFVHSLTLHSSSILINKVIGATTLHPTAPMLPSHCLFSEDRSSSAHQNIVQDKDVRLLP